MSEFTHQRHKRPSLLDRPRELVLVCAPLRSNVNLSRLLRTAGCCGVRRIIACGRPKVDDKIARIDPTEVKLEIHRTLTPVLEKMKVTPYQLVGLEQTSNSECIYDFRFERQTALVIGNERLGLEPEALQLLDRVVEIPVFGQPFGYNVATATAMALYEYCRQFPDG
jgi:tRNA G18 (ribose-2'-O)-methylase SpoU